MPEYAFPVPPYQPVVIYRAAGDFLTDLVGEGRGPAAGPLTLTLPPGSYRAVAAAGGTGHWPGAEVLPSLVQPLTVQPL